MSKNQWWNTDVNQSRRQALRTLGTAGTVGVASLAGTGTALGDQLDALVASGQIQPQQADQLYTEVQKLAASDGDPVDFFGVSVALAEETALIGARLDEEPNGYRAGSAYVFTRSAEQRQ